MAIAHMCACACIYVYVCMFVSVDIHACAVCVSRKFVHNETTFVCTLTT